MYHQLHASIYVFPRNRFRKTYSNASISPPLTTKKKQGGTKGKRGEKGGNAQLKLTRVSVDA
nr:MAG TPA: hypothetical protein [Herelleviridae sp.]